MRAVKGKDTKPEMAVRRLVHGMGYRYRLHRRDLPGKPDLAFGPRRKAIFVHGCFWHQHAGCRSSHVPVTRAAYWGPKLARNVERDVTNQQRLEGLGWRLLAIWECELGDMEAVAWRARDFLGPPGGQAGRLQCTGQ